MPVYHYKAKNPQGAIVNGTLEVANEHELVTKLRAQQLVVVSSKIQKKGFPLLGFLKKKPKASTKDLSVFSRQFATMINAGLPVLQSLNIIVEQLENPGLKQVIAKIRDDIAGGSTLSDSFAKHPTIFNPLYVYMIKAGESAGILDAILERLSGYLEKADALKRKVKSAMVYPAVVSSIAIAVVFFLLVGVIPTFKDVFSSFGAELPLPTKILLGISEFLTPSKSNAIFYLIFIGLVISGFIALSRFRKTKKGGLMWDGLMLKMPVFGMLLRKVAIARFARTLGTLIKSGVPILEALEIVARTAGNMVIEEAVMKARNSIREGENISTPLKASGIFPPMVSQMISVGEETGAIDEMLIKSADFYDDEVDTAVVGLTAMIEPLLMAFMGATIGAIVVAMFMPMFELGSLVGD
ncbi:MAG: type II secretion system F family protein [Candidatus Firestonebacteria bacterium]